MMPKTGLMLAALSLGLPLSVQPCLAGGGDSLAPAQLISSQVTTDPVAQTITFALTFDRAPDLHTYNAVENAADEFSIDILNEPLDLPVLHGAGGEDVRILSSQYRVTDPTVPYGRVETPLGYAAITTPRFDDSLLLDLVPSSEAGATVTITAPYAMLHETDGLFEAVLETYRYGAWSGNTWEIGTVFGDPALAGQGSPVPSPEPASLAVMGLGSTALLVRRRKGH